MYIQHEVVVECLQFDFCVPGMCRTAPSTFRKNMANNFQRPRVLNYDPHKFSFGIRQGFGKFTVYFVQIVIMYFPSLGKILLIVSIVFQHF